MILLPDLAVDTLFEKYVPPRFTYEGVFRKLVYPYPRDGIRELIVNAVVHMDYHSKEPVTVSVHPDHLEIFGVGGLPNGWTVETLVGKHKSIPRNQTLADVFHDAGYVENWAQGIGRVMDSCRVNGNPPPNFALMFEDYPLRSHYLPHMKVNRLNHLLSIMIRWSMSSLRPRIRCSSSTS